MLYGCILALHVFAIALSVFLLIFSIYRRQAPKSLFFAFMALSIFLYTMGYFLEITAPTQEAAFTATQMEYLGVPFVAPLLLIFLADYCGRPFRPSHVVLLLVIPIATCLLVLTWPWNGIYYSSVTFLADAVIPHLAVTGSPFYYLFFAYTYAISLVAVVVPLARYRRGDVHFKKQARILVVATAIPVVGNALSLFKLSPFGLDTTPVLMSITSILLSYSFLRLGLFRIAPLAREQIVETMNDAFILADMDGGFVDANGAAVKLFPQLAAAAAGTHLSDVDGLPWHPQDNSLRHEFSVETPAGKHYYRTSATTISHKKTPLCSCIMIYDITEARQLLDEVSALATHDTLTGLLNRGTFFENAQVLFDTTFATDGDVSVIMLDLDYFKRVNDTYGHMMGDEVLATIAQKLSGRFRKTDLFARYGGEEFCAMLPDAPLASALAIAEQLRAAAEQQVFLCRGESFHITISVGVAQYDPARHATVESLLADADDALYAAKNAGRNRVAQSSS